jgi:hypothetical protein
VGENIDDSLTAKSPSLTESEQEKKSSIEIELDKFAKGGWPTFEPLTTDGCPTFRGFRKVGFHGPVPLGIYAKSKLQP